MVIVTELLTGGTLRKCLLNLRPMSMKLDVAIGFALDIARAMECLHSHGIIHRDLKPGTVIYYALWTLVDATSMPFTDLCMMLKPFGRLSFASALKI